MPIAEHELSALRLGRDDTRLSATERELALGPPQFRTTREAEDRQHSLPRGQWGRQRPEILLNEELRLIEQDQHTR